MEAIVFDLHQEHVLAELRGSWPSAVKIEANTLLKSVTDFDFVAGFAILYNLLLPLEGITTKLQGKDIDIYKAYSLVNSTKTVNL